MSRRNLVMGSGRELGAVGLVAGLCGGYAAVLTMASNVLATAEDDAGGSVGLLLGTVSGVFILIALYVAAVVITNCVATVIAGRLRHLALLRLLGSDSTGLRRRIARDTTRVGVLGALSGLVAGTVLADLIRVLLVHRATLPDGDYAWFSLWLLPAVGAIAVASALAGWAGSRTVLTVSPAQAMTGAAALTPPARRASRIRAVISGLLIGSGGLLLLLSIWAGEQGSAPGFFIAFFGATISGTGLLIGARFVIPWVVAALSRLVGNDSPSLIARRNAIKDPMRTTRSTMGLVIGVALVTTFAAGTAALRASLESWDLTPSEQAQADQVMAMVSTVMICIIVISSIIAAVGFVSTMSLTVIQRGREIGLLRALGFTAGQVRTMITKEAVALSAAAVSFGIGLGLVYGAVGAQSLVGVFTDGFVWGLPLPVLAIIAVSCVLLVIVSSRAPARRAVAISTIDALRIET